MGVLLSGLYHLNSYGMDSVIINFILVMEKHKQLEPRYFHAVTKPFWKVLYLACSSYPIHYQFDCCMCPACLWEGKQIEA